MRILTLLLMGSLLAACGTQDPEVDAATMSRPSAGTRISFTSTGDLERPPGYRSWIHVGTPLTPNDMNNGKAPFPEFHTVYINPESYEAYKRDGKWRDGTIFMKELSSVGGKSATSGNGYFQGRITGLEAAVKSRKQFPNEPGNWGYFRFTDEAGGAIHRTASAVPTAGCSACHQSSAKDDFVFTQYYPMLREAKQSGPLAPEDRPGT